MEILHDMSMSDPLVRTATILLQAWRGGDRAALDRLLPIVYDELSGLAGYALRSEQAGHTLQTRALVHEVYVRLVDADVDWRDRAHFMAVAARTMRRVLVDHARARRRHTRGGDPVRLELEDGPVPVHPSSVDILDLSEALDRPAAFDARKSEIVELHYFGGLSYDETAEAVGLSAATVDGELRLAKAWLRHSLGGGSEAPGSASGAPFGQ
jgi:RNA polymerase sigma factor (TIGR02999 family)